ncbi:hypothetical protein T01_9582 [Trichinella spiralis]|uniref:FLYWCH-type domain-containing protein n=1 Tax=Trichinella spiralis TaxID=6334 RepID=A0A0V1BZY7_TRISP|nr:hypothetical protein T01_9582 [Trichinella spiralis]
MACHFLFVLKSPLPIHPMWQEARTISDKDADAFELRLVPNRCGGMSLVYENRAYKLKYATPKRVKFWGCSKHVISSGARVQFPPTWIGSPLGIQTEQKATLKKRTAEVTKSTPEIYDEEVAAASVEPSTAGQYPVFKQRMKSGLLATNIAWAQTVHSRFYQNGINNCSLAMPLQWSCYLPFRAFSEYAGTGLLFPLLPSGT